MHDRHGSDTAHKLSGSQENGQFNEQLCEESWINPKSECDKCSLLTTHKHKNLPIKHLKFQR